MDRAVWSNLEILVSSHTVAKKKNESNRSFDATGQSGLATSLLRFLGHTKLGMYSVGFL
jgi:hypothetical protein